MSENIDLKWSLWSADESTWKDYAPATLDKIKNLTNTQSLVIRTAPKKEIRSGTVAIERRNDGSYKASGKFFAFWDDIDDLADTLDVELLEEYDRDVFIDTIPFTEHGEPGVQIEFTVGAPTWQQLLVWIDEQEADLLLDNEEKWKEVEEMYKR